MTDFSEMVEAFEQDQKVSKYVNSSWHSEDNPWMDHWVFDEVELLNLYQKMYNGED